LDLRYRAQQERFRAIVREMLSRGQYPDNASIKAALGRDKWRRSGLTEGQVRWRIEEVERAGFDWEASRARRKLVKAEEPR
jgi:hypothetical protein